jgi:2-polyprenyl-3-methyl-5-hydroxy-6-metoxy-1,4-benzoquinol methylase
LVDESIKRIRSFLSTHVPITAGSEQGIHQKEADFHDQWAANTPLESISVREAFEAPTAPENRFILRMMGDLTGKRLLDVGAGLGESSVYFALKGAKVTATDLSPQMVQTAVGLGQHHGVEIEGIVTAGETLDVPAGSYDLVYIANTIHHVTNKGTLFEQVRRALKPGGRFFSWDPLAYNPVIEAYRRMATQVRTEDESPLTFADVKLAGQYFQNVGHREFQIATLAIFLKYYFVDRVHPNQDRYWKRILRETDQSLWWWQPLRAADGLLTRLPLVRRLAWNMVMWGTRL